VYFSVFSQTAQHTVYWTSATRFYKLFTLFITYCKLHFHLVWSVICLSTWR